MFFRLDIVAIFENADDYIVVSGFYDGFDEGGVFEYPYWLFWDDPGVIVHKN